jgi:hypothetical protein
MTYNFSDTQSFKPISQAAQRLLKDAGKATKFTAGLFTEFYPFGSEETAMRISGLELVNAGYASTASGGGSYDVKLTEKGAALSRYLSS